MNRKDYKERYRLIVERIKLSPCTFDQLKSYLLKSNYFQRMEIHDISQRTLQRDFKYIESDLDIIIKSDRGKPSFYHVMNETPEYI
ncbi:hypothetical protein ATB96_05140 [Elizabethkingia ursingii]|nr:hypothetical protein ATB96_05140 [Elizabethkingia ursingii]